MSILQTIDLKKYYGTEPNITRALDGVNLSLIHISHCGELAFFIVDFSGKLLKYVAADPRLLSIHSSIARELKWRYICLLYTSRCV